MKKNVLTIIISVISLCIVGLGVYFILKSNNNNNNNNNNTNNAKNVNLTNCKYDGKIELGVTFEKDNYLYTYVEVNNYGKKVLGWNVKYIDLENEKPITAPTCGKVSDEPIISAYMMYANTRASSIDVSTFNTTDVIDMTEMFLFTNAKEIKGLNTLDTSKVINMDKMFYGSSAKTIDISGLNTGKVALMSEMFEYSNASEIFLNDINTSNVINMSKMFAFTKVAELDLSSFNIERVETMEDIFIGCNAHVLVENAIQKNLWNTKLNEKYFEL